jgi:hypothetical protein
MKILWYKTSGFATGNSILLVYRQLSGEMPDWSSRTPDDGKRGKSSLISDGRKAGGVSSKIPLTEKQKKATIGRRQSFA